MTARFCLHSNVTHTANCVIICICSKCGRKSCDFSGCSLFHSLLFMPNGLFLFRWSLDNGSLCLRIETLELFFKLTKTVQRVHCFRHFAAYHRIVCHLLTPDILSNQFRITAEWDHLVLQWHKWIVRRDSARLTVWFGAIIILYNRYTSCQSMELGIGHECLLLANAVRYSDYCWNGLWSMNWHYNRFCWTE